MGDGSSHKKWVVIMARPLLIFLASFGTLQARSPKNVARYVDWIDEGLRSARFKPGAVGVEVSGSELQLVAKKNFGKHDAVFPNVHIFRHNYTYPFADDQDVSD